MPITGCENQSQNKRLSELNELQASNIKPDDLFLITDTAPNVLESKKVKALSLKNYILNGGSITASITNAVHAETASYINPDDVGLIDSASYAISSSRSEKSYWSKFSDTASYIDAVNIHGEFPSSSYSKTASFLLYQGFYNGTASYALSTSLAARSLTSSYIFYIPGQNNGTVSFAISAANCACEEKTASYSKTASFLLYQGFYNGTASYALTSSFSNRSLTASFSYRSETSSFSEISRTSSYSSTSSYSINSLTAVSAANAIYSKTASYLLYTGIPNGTASYALFANNAYFSVFSNTSFYCDGTASYSLSSSRAETSSYSMVAERLIDPQVYRMWGPYNSNAAGGITTTSDASVDTFVISPPELSQTTVTVMALCDVNVPITTTDTDLMTVGLYIDSIQPGNEISYGPLDIVKPNNYVNLAVSGAIVSGYNRQSVILKNSWYPISGSWYRLSLKARNGATIETNRGATFFIYTHTDTDVEHTF